MDKHWNVKVGDFGMAKVLKQDKSMTVCGTAETCAPEVLCGNRYSEKADCYSFGIVLWEMITREELYPGMNFYELSSKVVNEDLRPDLKNKDIPPVLQNLMKRCWNKNPDERPNFHEIVNVLEKFLDNKNDEVKNVEKKNSDSKKDPTKHYSVGF